ncbi:MAG: lycopene cyclase domain-containing protein [Candidatus Gracilibacteria bacterium]|jgi:hypothetical protein
MPSEYAYLTGGLLLLVFWLAIFLKRKDLHKEIVWASLIGLPFGFIEILFVPHYWHPESLFDFMKQYGFGLEGFVYSFSVAGLAAVLYEFLEKRKITKIKHNKKLHLGPFLLFLLVYLGLEIFFPTKPMLDLSIAFACGAIFTIILRPDLLKQVVSSGLIFSAFYLLLFAFVNIIFKDLVVQFYNPQILGNFKIIGVPLEEIIGAFTGGAFWSTLYEYAKAYREK